MGAAAGSNYFHPGSRTISFVVKGAEPTDRVKLRLLKVVEVNLVVAQTFDTFFADNNVRAPPCCTRTGTTGIEQAWSNTVGFRPP